MAWSLLTSYHTLVSAICVITGGKWRGWVTLWGQRLGCLIHLSKTLTDDCDGADVFKDDGIHVEIREFRELYQKPDRNFFTRFHLCHWSIFSSVHPLLDAGQNLRRCTCPRQLRYDISGPQAGFCKLWHFGRVKIAASEPLKRVTG